MSSPNERRAEAAVSKTMSASKPSRSPAIIGVSSLALTVQGPCDATMTNAERDRHGRSRMCTTFHTFHAPELRTGCGEAGRGHRRAVAQEDGRRRAGEAE